jgi:hypothetical protein
MQCTANVRSSHLSHTLSNDGRGSSSAEPMQSLSQFTTNTLLLRTTRSVGGSAAAVVVVGRSVVVRVVVGTIGVGVWKNRSNDNIRTAIR